MNLGYLFGLVGVVAVLVLEGKGEHKAALAVYGMTCLAILLGLVQV